MKDNAEILKTLAEKTHIRYAFSGDEFQVQCTRPGCSGVGLKFYFNVKSNKGHCFRCDYAVHSLEDFITRILKIDFKEAKLEIKKPESLKEEVYKKLLRDLNTSSAHKTYVSLPDKCKSVYMNKNKNYIAKTIMTYLAKRGFTYKMIERIDPLYSFDFPDWVILPIKMDKKIVYWIRRTLGTQEPKYIAAKAGDNQYSRMDVVWGYDGIKQGKPLVICEGIFSASSVIQSGFPAAALLGKTMSKTQRDLILDKKPLQLIVAFDGGAYGDDSQEKAQIVVSSLIDFVPTIKVVLPRNYDPNDYLIKYSGKNLGELIFASILSLNSKDRYIYPRGVIS